MLRSIDVVLGKKPNKRENETKVENLKNMMLKETPTKPTRMCIGHHSLL